jgi:hypothetical protein
MVTNFEDVTKELSDEECKYISILITGFQKRTKDNPIKAPDIIKNINTFVAAQRPDIKKKLSEPRLRKLCNYIRTQGLIPLIATSNGYYVSYDKEEIQNQIQSLNDRANAIIKSSLGLVKFLPPSDRFYITLQTAC